MKKTFLIVLVAILLLVGCNYNIETTNNTTTTEAAKQGDIVFTLENHLTELGTDPSAIAASSYLVDVYSNGQKTDSFTVGVSTAKFVGDDKTVSVSKTYQAGEYTAIIYAQDADGLSFGKGILDFTVIAGTTVSKTGAVEYKIHSLDDFVEPQACPVYYGETLYGNLVMTNTKNQPEVKYVELAQFLNVMAGSSIYNATMSADGSVYRVTNKYTEAYLEVDSNKETLYFSNYEKFFLESKTAPLVTAMTVRIHNDNSENYKEKYSPYYILHQYDISGTPVTISYGRYMVGDDSQGIYSLDITPWQAPDGSTYCYIPLNIATDLFWKFQSFNYNGVNIVAAGTSNYYNPKLVSTTRSQTIAEFNYIDFCFNMDFNYGLAQEHGITDGFNNWLKNLDDGSVYKNLMSSKTSDLNQAYYDIVLKYFGDLHSNYRSHSFYDETAFPGVRDYLKANPNSSSTTWKNLLATTAKIESARDDRGLTKLEQPTNALTNKTVNVTDFEGLQLWGLNPETSKYEKIEFAYSDKDLEVTTTNVDSFSGITLFVTFNEFTSYNLSYLYDKDYYTAAGDCNAFTAAQRNEVIKHFGLYSTPYLKGITYDERVTDLFDTAALAKVANRLVKDFDRLYPSIKITNIVVDLADNTGGTLNTETYIASWLIGQVDHCIINPKNGAESNTTYIVDVNGDGKVGTFGNPDPGDTVCDKNIFVVTSRCSFSCGNLLPVQLKAAGKSTILGSTTGGGSCAVLPVTTVDGTFLTVSESMRLSTEKNGSFYDIDEGVAADYQFTAWDDYANRGYITKVVNNL